MRDDYFYTAIFTPWSSKKLVVYIICMCLLLKSSSVRSVTVSIFYIHTFRNCRIESADVFNDGSDEYNVHMYYIYYICVHIVEHTVTGKRLTDVTFLRNRFDKHQPRRVGSELRLFGVINRRKSVEFR